MSVLSDALRTEVLYLDGNPDYPTPPSTMSFLGSAADELDAKDAIIAELREALERIAFEGVDDREKLMRSALDYVNTGGRYPNERTIAAAALSKASQDKGPTA